MIAHSKILTFALFSFIIITMKYAIVGSRKWCDQSAVYNCVKSLPNGSVVVSGGCVGVDTWAEDAAIKLGIKTIIFKPDLSNCKMRHEFTKAYHARNKLIAQECDILLAFVSHDRKGGTENTIKHTEKLNKKIILYHPESSHRPTPQV
jgi:predicted Rossmann fold nucleotide-binding protein DprA/Smf involved in DNA uptake